MINFNFLFLYSVSGVRVCEVSDIDVEFSVINVVVMFYFFVLCEKQVTSKCSLRQGMIVGLSTPIRIPLCVYNERRTFRC